MAYLFLVRSVQTSSASELSRYAKDAVTQMTRGLSHNLYNAFLDNVALLSS